MKYTHNSDPNYYYENQGKTNCGSLAFNLKEWYDPGYAFEDEYGYTDRWIEDLIYEGFTEEDISNFYVDTLLDFVLADFDNELRIIDFDDRPREDEELVSFAAFCYYDDDFIDYDFHFRVFRNGKWIEKQGCGPIEECDINNWGSYISKVYYLAHKIGDKNETS